MEAGGKGLEEKGADRGVALARDDPVAVSCQPQLLSPSWAVALPSSLEVNLLLTD